MRFQLKPIEYLQVYNPQHYFLNYSKPHYNAPPFDIYVLDSSRQALLKKSAFKRNWQR